MISLTEHIEYLMHFNDCVIVPKWGALIAHYSPAKIENDLITPPCRTITFNPSINHNDGLLATSLVRRHGISYDTAVKVIGDNVTTFKRLVDNYNEVPFGRLGYFIKNHDQFTEFITFPTAMRCDAYYGLTPVKISTIEHLNASNDEQQPIETNHRNVFVRRISRVAASIVALLALTILLTTPLPINNDTLQATLSVPEITAPSTTTMGIQHNAIATEIKASQPQQQQNTPQVVQSETFKYHLIIAAWKTKEQAQLFVESNPDLNLTIYEKGKNFLISAGDSNEYSQLVAKIPSLPKQYQSSWISD